MPRFCAGSRLPALPLSCRFLAPISCLPTALDWTDNPFHSLSCVHSTHFLALKPFSHWSHLGATAGYRLPVLPISCRFLALDWTDNPFHSLSCVHSTHFLALKPFSHWSHLGATVLQIASSTYFLPLSYPGLNWQPLSLFPSPRLLLPKAPRSFHSFQLFEGFSSFLTTTITFGEIDWSLDSPEQCETSYFMFLFKTPLFNLKHHASCFFKKSLWHSQPI